MNQKMRQRRLPRPIIFMTFCLSLLIFGFWAWDLRLNLTSSMPIGIWRLQQPVQPNESLRGQVALFCPPDSGIFRRAKERGILRSGSCEGSFMPLLKEVVGLPGDVVEYVDGGYSVNGRRVANSRIQPLDLGFKPAFYSHLVVPDGYVWLMSSYSAQSFDSRYFGPVERSRIYAYADAILVLTSR